jgi:outer membrane immunogenic protein
MKMKKLVVTLSALAAFTGSALAADMAPRYSKAPPPPPAPVASWTGCYVGGGGGYGLYDIDSQQQFGAPVLVAPNPAFLVNRPIDQGGRGWIGTAQAGCDYQFGMGTNQFVVGAFGDYNFSNIKGNFTGDGPNVGLVSGSEKVDWYWAVGGRIGWLVNPATLTYFSAGYTEAHRTGVANYMTAINTPIGIGLNGGTSTGWFLGSGIEHQIGWIPNLTWKTEYRFSEFDWKNNAEYVVASGINTGFFSRDKLYTQTIVSTLSYRFNFGGPAVVAKY